MNLWRSCQTVTSMNFFVLGILSRNPHFGAFPKLLVAVAVGHIYGRLSYIPICEKKLRLKLPDTSFLRTTMQEHYERHYPPPPPPPKK